jgi:hypothetical protein
MYVVFRAGPRNGGDNVNSSFHEAIVAFGASIPIAVWPASHTGDTAGVGMARYPYGAPASHPLPLFPIPLARASPDPTVLLHADGAPGDLKIREGCVKSTSQENLLMV